MRKETELLLNKQESVRSAARKRAAKWRRNNLELAKLRVRISHHKHLHKYKITYRKWKQNNQEAIQRTYKRKINSGFTKANNQVMRAIRMGILPRLTFGFINCFDCGETAYHYDHRDYNKPLEVEPVCRSCNFKRGSALCQKQK